MTDSFEDFFVNLYSLSLVPIDKQKVLYKGKFLKVIFLIFCISIQPDMNPNKFKLKNGAVFMLIGKAEGSKKIPPKPPSPKEGDREGKDKKVKVKKSCNIIYSNQDRIPVGL